MGDLDQNTASTFSVHGSRKKILSEAIDYVITGSPEPPLERIGDLNLPSGSAEASRCLAIRDMIRGYEKRDIKRPLSFAVFGPPGSGKSFCVKEVVKAAGCRKPFLINLSQLSSPDQLAQNLKGYLSPTKKDFPVAADPGHPEASLESGKAKVIFFDEFDSSLASESLGWLRWFLSPMQDGKFFLGSEVISVEKSIFMFAGGTAVSLAEFEKRALEDPDEYRDKKVPDFISRLRGYIDIQGIDSVENEGIVRRALVLHRFLNERWPNVRKSHPKKFPIDRDMTESLLFNIHFVHGVRSMEALLDMSSLNEADPAATVKLPEDDLLKLHLSRGSLDGKVIGISAGHEDLEAKLLLKSLTENLLQHGATLAYGGDFVPEGTLSMVIAAAGERPDKLFKRADKRIRNYLAFPTFFRDKIKEQLALKKQTSAKKQVEFIKLNTLSDSEIAALQVPRKKWFAARIESDPAKYDKRYHLAWAISLFRMRARLVQDIHALIVLGGKNDGKSWGRFSGIAEEVMLALALKKPVYVLGSRGGGAQAVGQLLGLDSTVANPTICLADDEVSASLSTREFTLPGLPDLPRTTPQLRNFLFEHGITTPAWPRNGLSPDENRQLFMTVIEPDKAEDAEGCVKQIIQGLLRLDGNNPSRPPL